MTLSESNESDWSNAAISGGICRSKESDHWVIVSVMDRGEYTTTDPDYVDAVDFVSEIIFESDDEPILIHAETIYLIDPRAYHNVSQREKIYRRAMRAVEAFDPIRHEIEISDMSITVDRAAPNRCPFCRALTTFDDAVAHIRLHVDKPEFCENEGKALKFA